MLGFLLVWLEEKQKREIDGKISRIELVDHCQRDESDFVTAALFFFTPVRV